MEAPVIAVKPTFEESYAEVKRIAQSRRHAWTYLSLMEWNEVAAILIERAWKKWHLYDPARGPLENWLNTLFSNEIRNLIRNLIGRVLRPCVGGGKAHGSSCVHNLGGNTCEVTKSRTQCAECPLYAEWEKARQPQFHVKSPVALDNHSQEVSNMQGDFCDVEAIQETMHIQMRANLTTWEYRIYQCLFVRHMTPAATSAALEKLTKTWKRAPRKEEEWGYQFILQKQRWMRNMMFEALRHQGYDLAAFLPHE